MNALAFHNQGAASRSFVMFFLTKNLIGPWSARKSAWNENQFGV